VLKPVCLHLLCHGEHVRGVRKGSQEILYPETLWSSAAGTDCKEALKEERERNGILAHGRDRQGNATLASDQASTAMHVFNSLDNK
jgi:hypothetical protein